VRALREGGPLWSSSFLLLCRPYIQSPPVRLCLFPMYTASLLRNMPAQSSTAPLLPYTATHRVRVEERHHSSPVVLHGKVTGSVAILGLKQERECVNTEERGHKQWRKESGGSHTTLRHQCGPARFHIMERRHPTSNKPFLPATASPSQPHPTHALIF
jgi:hypothetical protein